MPSVMSVTGPVEATELGVTLPHEHLFIDLRNQFVDFDDPKKKAASLEPLAIQNLGIVRRNPYGVKDNLLIDDLVTVTRDARDFMSLGGKTIVDCTSIGISRNPKLLRLLALNTGLNVVAGSGYYTYDTHPVQMDSWMAEEIAEQIVRDITEGIDGTDIKAGVIGEIGTSDPVRPNERKNLLAAAIAHRATGAPIQVHTYPWGTCGIEVAELLVDEGVDPSRIVICHTDVILDLAYMESLLRFGVFVQFDNFGKEFYIDPSDRKFAGGIFPRDIERIKALKILLDKGHKDRLLITNDLCLKCMLGEYGGWGFAHILRHIVPMLMEEGIPSDVIDGLLQRNPRMWLTNA